MGLAAYHKKRDFRRTREPKGKVHPGGKRLQFVIQKHDASHLHYDFRLEWDGVLKSWAVPKGPSLDPKVRSLAIEVEDHPIEYGKFEGTIPEGEYGGGTVMLWDRGRWVPHDDPAAGLKKGRLSFDLEGEKLHGRWRLVRMPPRGRERKPQWLLMKSDDEHARPGTGHAFLEEAAESVKTGRDLEQIAGGKKTWKSNRPSTRRSKSKVAKKAPARRRKKAASRRMPIRTEKVDPASLPGAKKASMPDWIAPQLATLTDAPPSGGEWVYEIKYDGYRLLAFRDGARVRLLTRNNKDWTERFRVAADAVMKLPIERVVLDGEIVVLNEKGVSQFQALQQSLLEHKQGRMIYAIFDILYCDGYDVRAAPLVERKRLLESALSGIDPESAAQYSAHASGDGEAAFDAACKHGEEGLIFKRAEAVYVSRRTLDWLKVKCSLRREFVIGGFTEPQRTRTGFGALLLGFYERDNGLHYCGRVGTGFNESTLKDMRAQLDKIEQARPAFSNPSVGADARGVHWVKPTLVAEVGYRAMTADGLLRQPTFEGLRMDKKANDVTEDVPVAAEKTKPSTRRRPRAARSRQTTKSPDRATPSRSRKAIGAGEIAVAGVRLTHSERVLFPDSDITKARLAAYYEAVADVMMPFVADRPLMLVRCPDGPAGECFHQKHIGQTMPKTLRGVSIREKSKTGVYPLVDDAAGLVSLVQMSTVEIHGWQSRASDLERPDQIIFDLDPGEGVDWKVVIDAANLVRDCLERLELASFVKTSGGKGLHIVAPLKPAASWDDVKSFAEALSTLIRDTAPDRFVAKMTKSIRGGKIYVDYLRNGRGATCVVPYSTRGRPGAPVSMPVSWPALKKTAGGGEFTLDNASARIRRAKNPWEDFDKSRRPLTAKIMAKLGL